jgi:hypothetical protein
MTDDGSLDYLKHVPPGTHGPRLNLPVSEPRDRLGAEQQP